MNKIISSIGLIILISIFPSCKSDAAKSEYTDTSEVRTEQSEVTPAVTDTADGEEATVIELTGEEFQAKVFDWKNSKEWKYLGDKPAILDFYASWCGPCRILKPRLKSIAKEYGSDIVVYSIDAESVPELSALMGVQAYPTVYFVPKSSMPTQSVGLLSIGDLRRAVDEILLEKKK